MEPTRPHRFANRVGGAGGIEEVYPPCKLIDVGNAKRYMKFNYGDDNMRKTGSDDIGWSML